jgi:Transcriptional regulator containing an amidase domain and an AraC-type DNA-binding HTH domain
MYPFFEVSNSGSQNFFNSFAQTGLCFPPHLHPYVELIYVIEGSILVTINERAHLLSAGEAAMCFPNDIHAFDHTGYSKNMSFIFSSDMTSSYFSLKSDKTLENPFISKEIMEGGISSLLYQLHDEFLHKNNIYVIKGLLYTILGKLDSYFILKKSSPFHNNTVQTLLKYIEAHYQETITLECVAKDLGFSKYYLSRIFSNKIGYQFNDYINRLRINKAQKLLRETDIPITIIALECGFESQRNFNRIFKNLTAHTPTRYRNGEL